jgi:hypothetical protein
MTDADIVKRLDTVISILQLAYSSEIATAREKVRADPVNLGVLNATESDFVGAGELKKQVSKNTSQSEKTVQRRIHELLTLGALEKRGSGPTVAYRATGLI